MKAKLLFIALLPVVFMGGCKPKSSAGGKASGDEKFVAVEFMHSRDTLGPPLREGWPYFQIVPERGQEISLRLLHEKGWEFEEENGETVTKIKYLTKSECGEAVKEKIDGAAEYINSVPETSLLWLTAELSSAKGIYVAMKIPPVWTANYFCIPADLWNSIPKPDYSQRKNVPKGEDEVEREIPVFFSHLKKCGLTDFNEDHVNVSDTPFICDKYSEENPVPYKSSEELIGL